MFSPSASPDFCSARLQSSRGTASFGHLRSTARGTRRWGGRVVSLLCVVLLCGVAAPWSHAQTPAPTASEATSNAASESASDSVRAGTAQLPIIRRVVVEGNTYFSDGELKKRIRTTPNRRILGIPGLTWWRWIYRLGSANWMWDRLGNALKSGGERPAVVDSTALDDDLERLRVFYEQRGFREASVDVEVRGTAVPDRVVVAFLIQPGSPTFIRRVRYDGLDALAPEQQERLARETVLDIDDVDPDNPLTLVCEEQRYEKPLLLEERRRLLAFLRNEGYADVSRDSIRALVYEPAPDSFDVTLRVRPGPRYRFGDVHFEVTGPESDVAPWTDTLAVRVDSSGGRSPRVTSRIQQDGQLGTAILRRSLQFEPGAYYDRSKVLATKRRLEGTGVFTFTSITPQRAHVVVPTASDTTAADTTAFVMIDTSRVDGARVDSARVDSRVDSARVDTAQAPFDAPTSNASPYLPLRIEARTRPRHRVRAETFVLQREVISDVENEFGVGVGLTYENANALGGGETFRVRTSGSIGADLRSLSELTSWQFEASTSLTLPYLIRPFDRFERLFDLRDARTRLSLSFLTAKREEFGLRIRGRGTGRLRLEMEHSPTLLSLVDVLDVSLSNPDALPGFDDFLDRALGIDNTGRDSTSGIQDPVQRAQIVEDYTQPQVNSALRYTLRSATANPLRRQRGHIYEVSTEVGNLLPLALDRFVFTPSELEYSLPGLSGSSNDAPPTTSESGTVTPSDRLLYRPYVRANADLRRYIPLSRGTTLAMKLYGGWAHPTAGPTVVPFDRRFFSGGATSVRGWRLRDLGPGGASLVVTADSAGQVDDFANILGGDVKLESSVEVRTTIFRNVLGANYVLATFLDAGNVWFGPRNPGLGDDGGPSGRFRVPDFLSEVGVGTGVGTRVVWEYLIVRFDLAWRLNDPDPAADFNGPLLHFGIGHAF